MLHLEDSELLSMFSDENSQNYAFNLIVKKYQQKIYWHIRRMVIDHDDANDVTQNTFIKAWKGLETFKQEAQLYTWLYRIATNESINFLNKKRKVLLLPLIDVERELSNKLEADAYFSGNVIQKKLQKALLQLPEKQRIVFNLKYFEEMKYEDMSTILNTSVGALKASYHIAVKKIEEYLKTH
ncbi:RNA polymerase sigma-H factor [Flavobacteriales bacterium]|nr:ECF RNA polymerase sigma-E factor [Flavobacteriales bacterium]MCL4816799.1 sigma-70 family RNA polymerase sigma factor [Flavobacteriales bacterium]WKZ74126.1 MAG: sigma-70 family RNA polymerase sigma factor [Vicingaceae bacterium]GIK70345.1 MAG: DNA-directed RNA polymerase sigma-70 factor [Bacteroidota bacterium]CAG0990952.1 RNA polymerase sigma-H factor [Flavobacteriales bacterium]